MTHLEEVSILEQYRNSLEPVDDGPHEIQYDEDGDMIYPPPIPLNKVGTIHRVLDETGTRLLTSKEAEKLGKGIFVRKPKGRNSLRARCTCGNKIPCDGNVMITKNESGKLQYWKIPRYSVGPAHEWECRQPAQFVTTPSQYNASEIFGGLNDAVLIQIAIAAGLPKEKMLQYSDPKRQKEENEVSCDFCESMNHPFYACPVVQDDSDETVEILKNQCKTWQNLLNENASQFNATARQDLEEKIAECSLRIESSKLYAHVYLRKYNKTWEFNRPGANWAEGEFSIRDAIRVLEKLPPPVEDPVIRIPLHFEDIDDAVKQSRSGQTIVISQGQHVWGGKSRIPAYTNNPHVLNFVCEGGSEVLPDGGCLNTIVTQGLDDSESQRLSRDLRMQSPTVLWGTWLLRFSSSGSFEGLSFYSEDGSMPGFHIVRDIDKAEEEPFEIGRRFRPELVTTYCFRILNCSWSFKRCDVFCLDGICLSLLSVANVSMTNCKFGAAGTILRHQNGTWSLIEDEGCAYMGADVDDSSNLSLVGCWVQLTQIYGILLHFQATCTLSGCTLVLNGEMGGAAIMVKDHVTLRMQNSTIVCGQSISPIWRETAALEASVSSGSKARVEISFSEIYGKLWLNSRRPRSFVVESVDFLPLVERKLVYYVPCKQQALDSGMNDPVQLWSDSRHEIWWPRHRMERLGYEIIPLPTDGNGQYRHVPHDDENPEEKNLDESLLHVWLNRTKKIELHPWGWDGTFDDVYDTTNPIRQTETMNGDEWGPLLDGIEHQISESERVRFKQDRQLQVASRTKLAEALIKLDSDDTDHIKNACREILLASEPEDLPTMFWLNRALNRATNKDVQIIIRNTISALSLKPTELDEFRLQLATVEVDEVGDPGNREVFLGPLPIPVAEVPTSILSAVWPHWPLYPQDRNTSEDGLALFGGPLGDEDITKPPRPWENPARVTMVKLDNESDVATLTFEERWQIAEAGFLPFPDQTELAVEVYNRDLHAWFRAMSDPKEVRLWIPVLRTYAQSMKIELPDVAVTAHNRRRQLESELKVMKDFMDALEISSHLHLTREDWRVLYPHLDVRRVFNPPTPEKLDRVYRRVNRLEVKLDYALEEERDTLMDAVYPLAMRAEQAFLNRDEEEIERLAKRRSDYSFEGRLSDNRLRFPCYLTPDGQYLVQEKSKWSLEDPYFPS